MPVTPASSLATARVSNPGGWRDAGRWLGPAAAAVAALFLILFGVAGVGRSGARSLVAFDAYYAAGRCWLAGSSMYDPVAFTTELRALGYDADDLSLGYTPAFAPFSIALAALPYDAARIAMWSFNLIGVALLCLFAIRLARDTTEETRARVRALTPWFVISVVAGSPSTAQALWHGQLTVWMVALTCGGWLARRHGHSIVAGILLGLTSVKPQFSFFLFVWLALNREVKLIVTAGFTTLVLCAYSMIAMGLIEPFEQFLLSVSGYTELGDDVNSLGGVHVIGLPSLLTAAGVRGLSVGPFVAFTCIGVVVAWLARRRQRAEGVLALLLTIPLALVYAHDYELVFLVPTWTWLWIRYGATSKGGLASLAMLFVVSIPTRFVTSDASGLLIHWRSVLLLPLLVLVVASLFDKELHQRESTLASNS